MSKKNIVFIIVTVLLVNALLLLIGWNSHEKIYSRARAEGRNYINSSLDYKKEWIAGRTARFLQSLNSEAANKEDKTAGDFLLNPKGKINIAEWLGTAKEQFKADDVYLLDEAGGTAAATDSSGNYKSNGEFLSTLNDSIARFSAPYADRGTLYVDAGITVEGVKNKKAVKGYLVARLNLGKLFNSLNNNSACYYKSENYFFIDRDNKKGFDFALLKKGRIIYSGSVYNFVEPYCVTAGWNNGIISVKNSAGGAEGNSEFGLVKVSGTDWYLCSLISVDEIIKPAGTEFRKNLYFLIGIDALFTLGAAAVALGLIGKSGAKKKKVKKQAHAFKGVSNNKSESGGEIDLDIENIGGNDETGFAADFAEKLKLMNVPAQETKEENRDEQQEKVKSERQVKQMKRIFTELDRVKNLGFIPKVLFEVNQSIRIEPENTAKLASIIGKDQSLTAKILAIANSPFYGLQRKATSIEFAVILLGVDEIQRLVTAISLSDSLRFPSVSGLKFIDYWRHSMLVGAVAKDIAERLGFHSLINEAFLGGIFHDAGVPICAKYLTKDYEYVRILLMAGKPGCEAELEVLGATHQEIGAYAVRKWELPGNILDVIQFHHNPSKSEVNKALAAIVSFADWLAIKTDPESVVWDRGAEFDAGAAAILGFNSIEERDKFTEEYNPYLYEAFKWIKL